MGLGRVGSRWQAGWHGEWLALVAVVARLRALNLFQRLVSLDRFPRLVPVDWQRGIVRVHRRSGLVRLARQCRIGAVRAVNGQLVEPGFGAVEPIPLGGAEP